MQGTELKAELERGNAAQSVGYENTRCSNTRRCAAKKRTGG